MARRLAYVPHWDAPVQTWVEPDRVRVETVTERILRSSSAAATLSPSANGRVVRVRIRNPKNSGFEADIMRIVLRCNASRQARVFPNGSVVTDLTTPVTIMGRDVPPKGSAMVVSTVNTTIPPIAEISFLYDEVLEGNVVLESIHGESPYAILKGGTALDVIFDDAGNLTTDVFKISMDWVELPSGA